MIILLTGLPGGGKSHGAMKDHVLPFLKETEQRLFTNIAGLNDPTCLAAIDKYCGREVSHRITFIDDFEFIRKSENWFHPETNPTPSLDLRGALIVVDEFPQYLSNEEKMPPHFMQFCLNHRRYTSDDGLPTKLIFIAQSSDLLHRQLRKSVIERTTHFYKMSRIGAMFTEGKYRYSTFDGYVSPSQMSKGSGRSPNPWLIETKIAKYDPFVFPCYSTSQASTSHKESSRGAGGMIRVATIMLMGLAGIIFCGYQVRKVFAPEIPAASASAPATGTAPTSPDAPTTSTGATVKQFFDTSTGLNQSAKFKGEFLLNGQRVFIFDQDGQRKYAMTKDFKSLVDYGPFIQFTLHSGETLSDVYTSKSVSDSNKSTSQTDNKGSN